MLMGENMDARVNLTSAGTGVLVIAGQSQSVQAASIQAARGEVIARVSAAAQEVGRALRLEITEPDSHWRVEVSPSGQVSNLPAPPPPPVGSAAVAPTPDEADETEGQEVFQGLGQGQGAEDAGGGSASAGGASLPEGVAVMMRQRTTVSRKSIHDHSFPASGVGQEQESQGEVVSLASLMTSARPDTQTAQGNESEPGERVIPPSFPPASPSPAATALPLGAKTPDSAGERQGQQDRAARTIFAARRGRRGVALALAGIGIVAMAGVGAFALAKFSAGAQATAQDNAVVAVEETKAALASGEKSVIRAGGSSGLCQVEEEGVRCWGASLDAQTQAPAVITGVEGEVTKLAVGRGFGVAATADGGVWAWGVNDKGQLGLGDAPETGAAVKVGTLPAQAEQIVAGSEHACLTSAGAVWCFGSSRFGQVGGLVSDAPQGLTRIEGPQNVVSLGTSGYDTWASDAEGRVWAWGSNEWGQVDPDAPGGSSTPVLVAGGQ